MARRRKQTEDMRDWRTITDEKEKYQAYLCSREWAEKREAVHKRAGRRCERCRMLPISAVHHLSYARKYKESLEDLQGICQPCHDFIHKKRDEDPLLRPIILQHVIYLAGKISKGDWRTFFCNDMIRSGADPYGWAVHEESLHWNCFGRTFRCHYAGPLFTNCGHGEDHGSNVHGMGGIQQCKHDDPSIHEIVFRSCVDAINEATAILAWFDDPFQYGTIFELGVAASLGKPVMIGFNERVKQFKDDLWFPFECAEFAACFASPIEFVSSWLECASSVWMRGTGHGG